MRTVIHEIEKFRDRRYLFQDRFEAGEILAGMLKSEYAHIAEGMVLAVPAGGVPVGIQVRDMLGLSFDLIIVRKLKIPGNPEAGFGAMTLDGTTFLNESLLTGLRLRDSQIEAEKARVRSELENRNARFRGGRPFPDLAGKRVILVDDGLASGFTMLAAVNMVKKAGARETVVAVPTAPLRTIERISAEADTIFCPNIRTAYSFAVAEAYRHWHDLDEKEVQTLLAGC